MVTNDLVHHAKTAVQEKHAYYIDCGGKSPWFNVQVTCNHSLLGRAIVGILIYVLAKPEYIVALREYFFNKMLPKATHKSRQLNAQLSQPVWAWNQTSCWTMAPQPCNSTKPGGCLSFRIQVILYNISYHFGHFVLSFGHFVPNNNFFVPGSFRTHVGKFVTSSTV